MWGSAFADLAKKAQEQAHQAGGLFNLDSLQQQNSSSSKNNEDELDQGESTSTKQQQEEDEGILFESTVPPSPAAAAASFLGASLFGTPTPSPPLKQQSALSSVERQKFPKLPNMSMNDEFQQQRNATVTSVPGFMDRGAEHHHPATVANVIQQHDDDNNDDLILKSASLLESPLTTTVETAQDNVAAQVEEENWDWNDDENDDEMENILVDNDEQEKVVILPLQSESTMTIAQTPTDEMYVDEKGKEESPIVDAEEQVQQVAPGVAAPAPAVHLDNIDDDDDDDDDDDLDDMYAEDDDEEEQDKQPSFQSLPVTAINGQHNEVDEKSAENGGDSALMHSPFENDHQLQAPDSDSAQLQQQPAAFNMKEEQPAASTTTSWDFDADDLEHEQEFSTQQPTMMNGGSVEEEEEPDKNVMDVPVVGIESESSNQNEMFIEPLMLNMESSSNVIVSEPKDDDEGNVDTMPIFEHHSPEHQVETEETNDFDHGETIGDDEVKEDEAVITAPAAAGAQIDFSDEIADDELIAEASSQDDEQIGMMPTTSTDTATSGGGLEDEIARELGSEDAAESPQLAKEPSLHSSVVVADEATQDSSVPLASSQTEQALPASVMEDFAVQLRRLEEHHRSEMQEMERKHKTQLQSALDSLNHDKCEERQKSTEQMFLSKISEKEVQLEEVMRANEGYQLKIDVMKRELTGTRALLEERDSAMGTATVSHSKNLSLLEEKLGEKDQALTDAKAEIQQLKDALKESKEELDVSNETYSTLKARVKVVATELKERRVECRTLTSELSELTDANEQLQTQVANLQSQVSDRDRNQSEKDEEMEQLRGRVIELEGELKIAEKSLKERGAVGEKALSAYKKKAQSALALANSRTAAATQAKEEAELEASAARSTAEEAVERARVAEANGKAALAEAKEYVRDMESEKTRLEQQIATCAKGLEESKVQLQRARDELDQSRLERERLEAEVATLSKHSQEDRAKNSQLQIDLNEAQRRSNELYDEVETLREELRKSANAAFMAGAQVNGGDGAKAEGHHRGGSTASVDKSEAEGTILMLQAELRDANQAIKELKETLRSTIEKERSNNIHRGVADGPSVADSLLTEPTTGSSFDSQDGPSPMHSSSVRSTTTTLGNDATPLFFAMEKQAELNTARDEINRLANLLGDAQSQKMEAFEAMEEMRRKMEESEARLHRYEKLGSGMQHHKPLGGSIAPGGIGMAGSAAANTQDEGVVNLEYLKNVMLRYLNAKSLTERKALVPVVAAVLCLTPEETAKAMKSVEESGSLEGVGKSLFESMGSYGKNFL